MRHHYLLAASLMAALSCAQPALACRVPMGGPSLSVVISSPPETIPDGAMVLHGRFLNAGPEFDRSFAELPRIDGEPIISPGGQVELPGEMLDMDLIGVLVSENGLRTPIYDTAWCSNAHPSVVGPIDQSAWIVGWPVEVGDIRALRLAPRNRTGGWGI